MATATLTGTATLTAEVTPNTVRAAGRFTGRAGVEALVRPVGRRRRVVVVDMTGEPVGELENANIGSVTWTLNEPEDWSFTLPLSDPKAALLLDRPFREVQLWRGDQLLAWGPTVRPSADKTNLAVTVKGVAWYLTRRHLGRASRTSHVTNGDFEQGLTGWETGALSPLEATVNRNHAYWSASTPTGRSLTGRHALRLTQHGPALPKYGVSASQWFGWQVDPVTNREGDEWSLVAYCYIPSDQWLAPPPDGVGIRLARYSTLETVDIARDDGSAPVAYPKPIESQEVTLDDDTPRDVWWPMRVALRSPVTGHPEFVQITLGCPVGVIWWDRVGLTADEGLRFYQVDQARIVAGIVDHLQDPAYAKSNLNLTVDAPATGVLRDRTYLFHEHLGGADMLEEFTGLDDGLDLSVTYTATTRTLRTHHPARGRYRPGLRVGLARNVADFAWTFNGETASDTVIVLGSGNGSDREEVVAVSDEPFAGAVTMETVYTAPPDTPIDGLDEIAAEALTVARQPELLSVTLTSPLPGQPDPVGVLWPGDTIPVRIQAGALSVSDIYRVVELTLNPDDTLEVTLNRRDPT